MAIHPTSKSIVLAIFAVSLLFATVLSCSEVEEPEVTEETSEPSSSVAGILPPTVTPTPPSNEFAIVGQPERFLLEDLSLVGINDWINSEPLELDRLTADNRLVLLDFWTYTCVNCVRTFPYLNAWHDAYSDLGLVIIGVHSPEFEFEKVAGRVEAAARGFGIEYPIAVDSDKATWDKYGNHFWPSKYLINPAGEVVLRHFGEGGYVEFETQIRAVLEAAGQNLDAVPYVSVESPNRSGSAHTITRELYGGYSKNYLSDGLYAGQDAYYEAPDTIMDYVDDGTRRHGQFYLGGPWVNEESAVVTARNTTDNLSQFSFEFFATSVNSVLSSSFGYSEVIVEIDGQPVSEQQAGADITWTAEGESILSVRDPQLYQIIALPEFGKHELVLKTNSEGLAVYTVTFGVNEFGP